VQHLLFKRHKKRNNDILGKKAKEAAVNETRRSPFSEEENDYSSVTMVVSERRQPPQASRIAQNHRFEEERPTTSWTKGERGGRDGKPLDGSGGGERQKSFNLKRRAGRKGEIEPASDST